MNELLLIGIVVLYQINLNFQIEPSKSSQINNQLYIKTNSVAWSRRTSSWGVNRGLFLICSSKINNYFDCYLPHSLDWHLQFCAQRLHLHAILLVPPQHRRPSLSLHGSHASFHRAQTSRLCWRNVSSKMVRLSGTIKILIRRVSSLHHPEGADNRYSSAPPTTVYKCNLRTWPRW